MKQVTPNGNAPAKIMLVGDYPTEAEIESGKSFDSSSGDTVARLFKSAGLPFNQTWKTHFYKIGAPGINAQKKTEKDIALLKLQQSNDWTALIKSELDAIKPNLVIAMGELALQGLTGEHGMMKRAGSIYPLKPMLQTGKHTRVLAVHNTRHLYVDPAELILTKMDLKKGIPFIDATPPFKDDFQLVIGDKPSYVRDWIAHFSRGAKFGVFDVETVKNICTCICFCFDGINSMSIPLLSHDNSREERALMWWYVQRTLLSETKWVNQNVKYDMNRLEAMKFKMGEILGDTMLRTSLIYPELPKGLDFLTRLYTNIGYYKDEGKEYDSRIHDFKRMLLYNAKDGIATHRVFTAQEKDISALGLNNINDRLHRCFFIYRRMEDNGIRIDTTELARLKKFYDREIWLLESELNALAGRQVNAKSGDQIGPLLIEMGANPKIRTWDDERSKFKYKTGKVELEEMFVHVSDEALLAYVARLALAIRKLHKLRQFCDFIPQQEWSENKEIIYTVARTSYKLHGTETGRSATGELLESIYYKYEDEKEPDWYRPGFSMQQQPKHPWRHANIEYGQEFRGIFIPRQGRKFVEFDLSQAEARVVDVLSEDYEALENYGKVDQHCMTASLVNKLDYAKLKEQFELYKNGKSTDSWAYDERQKGKTYKHGFNYDESSYNLSRRTHLPFKEVDNAIKALSEAKPRVRNIFHKTIKTTLENTRTLVTPFGRKRTFFGNMNDKTFKEGYAHIPQSTIPDHLRFNLLFPLENKYGARVNFLVEWHDSLLAEVPTDLVESYAESARFFAQQPILFNEGTFIRNYELKIPIDLAKGDNWLEMQKI
jgi:uracil-DNA glycosylase family 4